MSEFKGIHQNKPKGGFTAGKISRRELLTRFVPFGKLELDSSRCTGCSLCTIECPTEALIASPGEEPDTYRLLFRQGSCFACGRCVEVCPEQCLRLEHVLEPDSMNSPATVLFEDKVAKCRECGSIIGSRAMIDRLQVKVMAKGKPIAAQFELCSMCKIKAPFSREQAAPKSIAQPD